MPEIEGLSGEAWRLYEQLVASGGERLDGAPGSLDEEDPAVSELVAAGYATLSLRRTSRKLAPVAPLTIYERILLRYQQSSALLDVRLSQLRGEWVRLHLEGTRERRLARSGVASVVADRTDVQLLAAQLFQTATISALTWNVGPYTPGPATGPELSERAVARPWADTGARIRSLYHRSMVSDPGDLVAMEESAAAGADTRVSDGLPMKLIVADRSTVLIPLEPAGCPAILVKDPALGSTFTMFFELLWAKAALWPEPVESSESATPRPATGDASRRVVSLMAAGYKDEAIARQCGLSVRTVRRQIGDMMAKLGVTNRFAFGVAAMRAGWIEKG